MNKEFIDLALKRGPEGKEWLNRIPSMITEYEKNWHIKVSPPFYLSYNYVAPAIRKNNSEAVIKIGFPKDKEFQTEIDSLEIFNGEGCEKLFEVDRENSIILIERVKPGIPLSTFTDDEEATKTLAGVMKKLWKPLPSKNKFITISEWMKAIPEYLKKHRDNQGPLPKDLIEKANYLFEELIATSSPSVLVHGDLHQDNVLSSERVEWLAIDPKGISAEREYETAAMIRNPYEKMKNESDLKNILRKRLIILSGELEFDIKRIHKWCFAQTVLSAVWNDAGVKGSAHSIKIAEALNSIKF